MIIDILMFLNLFCLGKNNQYYASCSVQKQSFRTSKIDIWYMSLEQ